MVSNQHGLDGLTAEGIIGLAPVNSTNNSPFEPYPELFIEIAYQQGAIDEKVFSLLIGAEQRR